MIEWKFTFFQMQIEYCFMDPTETEKPSFRISPETFDPIHMHSSTDKRITTMIDAEMFPLHDIDQAIVPTPPIRINYTVQSDLPANNRLQHGFPAVWDKFRVDVSIALENPKEDGFAIRSASKYRIQRLRPHLQRGTVVHKILRSVLEDSVHAD